MVSVPVPLVVHRDDVHQHDVLGVLVHPGERDPDGGEHPPDGEETGVFLLLWYIYGHVAYLKLLKNIQLSPFPLPENTMATKNIFGFFDFHLFLIQYFLFPKCYFQARIKSVEEKVPSKIFVYFCYVVALKLIRNVKLKNTVRIQ